MIVQASPAESLTGIALPGGWIVGQRLTPLGGTGGNFSVRYDVTSALGEKAFLKALDISAVLNSAPDVPTALKYLLELYIHERAVVEECVGLSRVVRGLSAGQVAVPGSMVGPVPYLIFEIAENGDIRRHLATLQASGGADVAWKLRSMHHIATGLRQLHSRGIAHQDLKPSNVLVFPGGCKVGDLGNSVRIGVTGPWDNAPMAGDLNYSPIESFYGFVSNEFNERRFGCDFFLLGSMAVFFFNNLSMLALLKKHLDAKFFPQSNQGNYSAVLPYVQNAFLNALAELRSYIADQRVADAVSNIVHELCHPDPSKRGVPQKPRSRPRFALEVYVSRFNAIARYAELTRRN